MKIKPRNWYTKRKLYGNAKPGIGQLIIPPWKIIEEEFSARKDWTFLDTCRCGSYRRVMKAVGYEGKGLSRILLA